MTAISSPLPPSVVLSLLVIPSAMPHGIQRSYIEILVSSQTSHQFLEHYAIKSCYSSPPAVEDSLANTKSITNLWAK